MQLAGVGHGGGALLDHGDGRASDDHDESPRDRRDSSGPRDRRTTDFGPAGEHARDELSFFLAMLDAKAKHYEEKRAAREEIRRTA